MRSADVRKDIRLAGQVKRYSTWPVLREQNTGEHSWQVLRIYIEIFGAPRPEVTTYIVHHDSAELAVGDPPFPLKANNPDLKAIYTRLEDEAIREMRGEELPVLSPTEMQKVKICDLIEMWEFGNQEQMMGNRFAQPIIEETLRAIMEIAEKMSVHTFNKVCAHVKTRQEMYK